MPLYKQDLDNMFSDCGVPLREDPGYLHSDCHIEEPTWCIYFNGILTVRCAKCNKVIAEIAVAERGGNGS